MHWKLVSVSGQIYFYTRLPKGIFNLGLQSKSRNTCDSKGAALNCVIVVRTCGMNVSFWSSFKTTPASDLKTLLFSRFPVVCVSAHLVEAAVEEPLDLIVVEFHSLYLSALVFVVEGHRLSGSCGGITHHRTIIRHIQNSFWSVIQSDAELNGAYGRWWGQSQVCGLCWRPATRRRPQTENRAEVGASGSWCMCEARRQGGCLWEGQTQRWILWESTPRTPHTIYSTEPPGPRPVPARRSFCIGQKKQHCALSFIFIFRDDAVFQVILEIITERVDKLALVHSTTLQKKHEGSSGSFFVAFFSASALIWYSSSF